MLIQEIHRLAGNFRDDVRDQLQAAVLDQRRQQPLVDFLYALPNRAVSIDQDADNRLFDFGQRAVAGHAQNGDLCLVGSGVDFSAERFWADERDDASLTHVADHARDRARVAEELQRRCREEPDFAVLDPSKVGRSSAQQARPRGGVGETGRTRHYLGRRWERKSEYLRHSDQRHAQLRVRQHNN